MRARFLGASSEGRSAESAPADQNDDAAIEKLRAWVPAAPRAGFEQRVREAFLDVEAAGAAEPVNEIAQHRSRQAGPKGLGDREAPRRARAATRDRAPSRFRLVAAGGVLAAAAAVIFFLQRPVDVDAPGIGTTGSGTTELAQSESPSTKEWGSLPSGWELDTSFGDAEAVLASVRIDGQPIASVDDFASQIAQADRVESVGVDLRIRHRDEFVMELASDTTVRLDEWRASADDSSSQDGPRVLFAESGSLRVATGPGFDPASSLIVETPHVRTEVLGTIFGLDIGADYTCVCCKKGAVKTQQLVGGTSAGHVPAGRTWIARAGVESPWQMPLEVSHRAPLDGLEGYWS